jgi:nitronate monooxygenase
MAIQTALTSLLGISVPVLLAPMAGVSGGKMAAAVTNAGGLGFIGGGYCDRDWLATQIKQAGNTRVGVGFITWALERDPEVLDIVIDQQPKAIFLSFGDIKRFVAPVKGANLPLIAQVQSVEQARIAASEGADVIVAQGTEAGGHGGQRATFPLVPAVVDAVGKIPVVAAGGIADGRGLAAALMLGASGVLCGTAFVAADESLVHPNIKKAAVAGSGDTTERSSFFDIARGIDWPSQWTIRTLTNEFSRKWGNDLDGLERNLKTEQARYAAARDAGDVSTSAVIVGEAVDLVRAQQPAEAILNAMVAQAEGLLKRSAAFSV